MTTESTDSIIDLLYGELSEEEESAVQKELAESAELRAELDGYEDLLGRIREAMPPEDVSPSVHASIMEAARAGAKQSAEDRVARRQPAAAEDRPGIWRRLSNSQGSQIALVAAVLIAGVFVVKFVDQGSGMNPMAPASDISAAREPAPAMAEQAPAEEAEETAAAGEAALAEADEEALDWAAPEPEPVAEPEPAPVAGAEESAADRDLERELAVGVAKPEAADKAKEKPRPRRRARAKPDPSKKAPSKKADGALDLWGGDGSAGAEKNSADDDLAAAEGAYAPPPTAEEDEAEAKPKEQYRPDPGSFSAVTERWRKNDYGGTIRAADEFLASKSGSSTQKANALYLKAQALEKQGRYSQAKRIYQTVKKNYPGQFSAGVDAGLERVEKQTRRRPARQKRKAKPKSTVDEMDLKSLE